VTVALAYDSYGEAGAPLVILHGLLGSARNWSSIARQLSETAHRVCVLDLRNHGRSPWADSMSFDAMAGDVAALIDAQRLRPAAVLGHSLGGKVAMRLALTRPELVARLLVVDVAPVAYAHSFGPLLEAMAAVDLGVVERRTDAERQLERIVDDPVICNFLLQNLVKSEGGFAWRVNLAALAANMPELLGFPAEGARPYREPTLFIAGSRSHYIKDEHRPLIERLFPAADLVTIAGAGHWVHAERPAEFLAEVRRFLR